MIKYGIQCQDCGQHVFSEHRHDYKSCKCGASAVDGGNDYLRVCGQYIVIRLDLTTGEMYDTTKGKVYKQPMDH